jgi:hypothetical protein
MFLQTKHDLNWIIYMNIKTNNMELTKHELNLIYNCLEDCANSDSWEHYSDIVWELSIKVKEMVNNIK